jgi:hypothetical protein
VPAGCDTRQALQQQGALIPSREPWRPQAGAVDARRPPGDDVVFTTGEDTVKGRSIRRDGRVSLCVDDDRPPFSFVTVDGVARIVDDPDELLRWRPGSVAATWAPIRPSLWITSNIRSDDRLGSLLSCPRWDSNPHALSDNAF